jgi:hypothetical protein
MPIDSSIALGVQPPKFESPINQLSAVLGIQQAQQANQINGMKMDSYRRDQERQNKLYSVLGSLPQGATDEDRISALSNSGFLGEADGVRQGVAKLQDTKSQAREREAKANREDFQSKLERANYIGSAMASVLRTPTVESAHATIDALASNGILSPEQAAQYKAQVAQNPAGIAQMAEAQYRAALGAKEQMLKEVTQNTGGVTNTLAFDPAVGKTAVVNSVKNTQSPDSIASNARIAAEGAAGRAVTMRGQNMADARAKEQAAATAGTGKLTEDQGKATGWLVQADNAFGNMKKAMAADSSAARPGLTDAIAAIPSFGLGEVAANSMRSPARQQFMQGASSLSEALLRAATGAGVNKDEALQKVKELTPVFGEDSTTTKQKMDSIPLYIESLKVRAGPGAKQLSGIVERAGVARGTPPANDIHSQADAILRGGK